MSRVIQLIAVAPSDMNWIGTGLGPEHSIMMKYSQNIPEHGETQSYDAIWCNNKVYKYNPYFSQQSVSNKHSSWEQLRRTTAREEVWALI